MSPDHVFIDSTHVKVGANKLKFEKKIVRKETRAYEAKRQEELNQERVDPWKIERVFATLNLKKLANWIVENS